MILCDRVSGGRGPRVFGLSLSLPPGLHAVVGEASDGTLAFAELVAGRVAPLVGRLTIGGVPPSTSPSLRAGLGLALEEPTLPDLGRVSDLLDAVAPRWSDGELATLVDALRPRRLGSLPLPDARRLALCLALRHDAPRAVVLHEPFGILPDALLRRRLGIAVEAGAVVVITTASVAEATALAETLHVLRRGRLIGSLDAVPSAAELEVWLPDGAAARSLARALGEEAAISSLAWEALPHQPAVLRLRATDVQAAARLLARAVMASEVEVTSLHRRSPSLEMLQLASAEGRA